jgi:phospholipase C
VMNPLVPGADPGGLQPVGLGTRVPMIIVSPWTAGGWVCSQTFDHTSVLRFLETRFGVAEPNISAWRRAVCGDLTSAFDFSRTAPPPTPFPTPGALGQASATFVVPGEPSMPTQEPGTRPARALPYELAVHARLDHDDDRLFVDFENTGDAGAAFYAYNDRAPGQLPRRYAIATGDHFSDYWPLTGHDGEYRLRIHGPNGFLREFSGHGGRNGEVADSAVEATLGGDGKLTLTNTGDTACAYAVKSGYGDARSGTLAAGATQVELFDLAASANWYDFSVTLPDAPAYLRRFAGHIENGRPSTSDPATA